jgi:L-2-hydroxyglutarate oxidase LhgO
MEVYDLCIIGAGLIGSSAAKHASKIHPNLKIALIGPPEPQVYLNFECFKK